MKSALITWPGVARCAGSMIDHDDVLSGCTEPATTLLGAQGTLMHDGKRFAVALCDEHARMANDKENVMTVTVLAK